MGVFCLFVCLLVGYGFFWFKVSQDEKNLSHTKRTLKGLYLLKYCYSALRVKHTWDEPEPQLSGIYNPYYI